MAASLKTAGTWATLTADGTVAIPGTPAAGDRMFLFVGWKTYTITVTNPSGWTPIGTEFADGTVAAAANAGSMKVMGWYRDWQSGDGDPTLDFSVDPTIAGAVIQLWTKDAGDTWEDPLSVTAAWALSSLQTVDADATLAVPDSSVVMALIAYRDDVATITRTVTEGIQVASGITWNGNYIESPSTHLSTTTGEDMAADLGHRLVTTGGTVTLQVRAGLSSSETGAIKWVVVRATANQTVTPGTAALTTTVFAPTVSTPRLVTPGVASLTITGFAPTVTIGGGAQPGWDSINAWWLGTQHSGAVVGANQLVTPGTASLVLTTFAPTVATPRLVTPGTASLVLTSFAPSVATPRVVTPGTATLTLTTFAPTVTVGGNQIVTPGTASLVLTTFAPTVTGGGSVTVTPTTASLTVTTFAPAVTTPRIVTPGTASLTLATFVPDVAVTADQVVTPLAAILTLTTFAPTIVTGIQPYETEYHILYGTSLERHTLCGTALERHTLRGNTP